MNDLVRKIAAPCLEYVEQGALFSPCNRYRYLLWRTWDTSLPRVLWVLLNPATATEGKSDPTNTRGERRAREMGFGTNVFCNLFAWRSVSPRDLRRIDDPIGPQNDLVLLEQMTLADMVIAGWGNHGAYMDRASQLVCMAKDIGVALHALSINGSGEPKHPLYCAYSVQPTIWRQPK